MLGIRIISENEKIKVYVSHVLLRTNHVLLLLVSRNNIDFVIHGLCLIRDQTLKQASFHQQLSTFVFHKSVDREISWKTPYFHALYQINLLFNNILHHVQRRIPTDLNAMKTVLSH